MRKVIQAIIISGFVACSGLAASEPKKEIKQGNLLYNEGKFQEALSEYEQAFKDSPDSDIVNFNLGTALYKTGDFLGAAEHFQKSLVSDQESIEQKASYNIGNAKYKYGLSQEDTDLSAAVDLLEQSLHHYQRALELDPEDKDARHNYEFVENELKRLREKLKQQQQTGQGQQQQDRQQQSSQEQAQQQPGQQGQQQQSQPQERQEQAQAQPQPQPEQEQAGQQPQESGQDKQQESARDRQSEAEQQQQSAASAAQQESEDKQARRAGSDQPTEGMSEQEALMLLKGYSQDEEPEGLYKENVPLSGLPEVQKDW